MLKRTICAICLVAIGAMTEAAIGPQVIEITDFPSVGLVIQKPTSDVEAAFMLRMYVDSDACKDLLPDSLTEGNDRDAIRRALHECWVRSLPRA
jgi:hypothetical protein